MDVPVPIPLDPTKPYRQEPPPTGSSSEVAALSDRLDTLIRQEVVSWEQEYLLVERLGAGGQGVVYLADRSGAFGVSFRLALKFFRPHNYPDLPAYRAEMARLARLAMLMSRIQHDHLLDVYNVIELQGIHVLATEYIDGFDLRHLLTPKALDELKASVDRERWEYMNDVVVTRTASQVRLKAGVAIAILRDCLSGMAALHRVGLVHADIKPANVMVKRTGACKIIDFGSSFAAHEPPTRPLWTPRYAAIEVLEGARQTPASDLASLGYVLYEMLSGQFPFPDASEGPDLVQEKRRLAEQLADRLPTDVARNSELIALLHRMIAASPEDRFASAEEAELSPGGAADFHRQLIRSNLASEYENEIRLWLSELE